MRVKASQSGSVSQTVANTEIVVTYDRPVARGRELFGGIVAYGEIWNPGANDATKSQHQSANHDQRELAGGRQLQYLGDTGSERVDRESSVERRMSITRRIPVRSMMPCV